MDIDPKKTPAMYGAMTNFSYTKSLGSGCVGKTHKVQDALDDAKKDKMVIGKVQNALGSTITDRSEIKIKPQKDKFVVMAVPVNMEGGEDAYARLFRLVQEKGHQGVKIYLDAYVKEDGILRVMLNDVKRVQDW